MHECNAHDTLVLILACLCVSEPLSLWIVIAGTIVLGLLLIRLMSVMALPTLLAVPSHA